MHHLRRGDARLVQYLGENRVVTCDVVIGELELGAGIPAQVADDLSLLPVLPGPGTAETRAFVERHRRSFRGAGVGWADAQIILAAQSAGARLYTSDRAAAVVWRRLGHRLA